MQSPRQADHALLLQRTLGNRATQRLIQREDGSPGTTKPPPSKTLYMGMNAGGKSEAAALKGILKDDVIAAMNDPALEKSLETDEGIGKWLAAEMPTLLRSPLQVLAAYETIRRTKAEARDQMAQVVKMFHAAEQGQFKLERIVLSGHSNGVELWGDTEKNFNPGTFLLDTDLQNLTGSFPTAAGQVEDVMFSACYTVSSIELIIKAFPNVRTVWGYAGLSPSAGNGAEEHIAQWEKNSRGDQTLDAKDGVGKAALWTREASKAAGGNGFIRNDPSKADLKELKAAFYGMSLSVKDQYDGTQPLNQGTLNNAYGYIQMMLAHPDFKTDSQHDLIVTWRDVLLRLRYYDKVRKRFAADYASEIKKGYDAIGRKVPDFANITRKALKTEKAAFAAALAATPNADAQAFFDKYMDGFWHLKPDVIPSGWI